MDAHKRAVLIPDGLSITAAILLGLVVVFLANAGYFFTFYGYQASAALVHQNTHNVIINFLQHIDRFELTDTIVTFLLWCVVGIFILALLQTVIRSYGAIRSDLDFTTDHYVKPQSFSRHRFFETLIFDILYLVLGMAMLLAAAVLFFGIALPYANSLIRRLASHTTSLTDYGAAALGILLTCLGVALITYLARLVVRRHYFLPS